MFDHVVSFVLFVWTSSRPPRTNRTGSLSQIDVSTHRICLPCFSFSSRQMPRNTCLDTGIELFPIRRVLTMIPLQPGPSAAFATAVDEIPADVEECAVISRKAVALAQPGPPAEVASECTSSSYPSQLGRVAPPSSCSSKTSSQTSARRDYHHQHCSRDCRPIPIAILLIS